MAKSVQLVVFSIGTELYGVGIESVHEIVRVPDITGVPDAPIFLKGVINLRGRVIPVIDFRKRLRLQGMGETKSTRVLITENRGSHVGLLVDSVSEVRKIQPDAIEEPPEMVSAIGVEYITGVAKIENRLIILIDLKKILSVDDMKKLAGTFEQVPQAA
jgi:purine-binding chemotaxis protein CheW